MTGLAEKILDFAKASGWQNFFLSMAFGLFTFLALKGEISLTGAEYLLAISCFGFFICGSLALTSFMNWASIRFSGYLVRRERRREFLYRKQWFIEDIPFLNENERNILGYFREKQEKRFTAAEDGGHANTLLAKGYIQEIAARGGQRADPRDIPMEVATHVWETINERPDDFLYVPRFSDGRHRVEVKPWRVHWMAR